MSYIVSLVSPLERQALIIRAINASDKKIDFYQFRSSKKELPIIKILIDIPVYRMENFRTFTDQKEYLQDRNSDLTLFEVGQEVESVQQIQHELLAKLANKGKENSLVPVIDVLRKVRQQEPLLITVEGIVVNGNRRLAAMRELFSEDSSEFDSFRYIEVMVLPADTTQEEIKDIEASLQGKPETKLDYDWIGDAQLVSSQVSIHKSFYDVSQRLNRSEKDIKNTLSALAEADLYLKQWANAEGQYSKVKDDAEQFFKDLPKALEGKSSQLVNASRYIAYSLFDNKDKLPTRFYDYNAAFGKLAEDVLDRLAAGLGVSTEKSSDKSNSNNDEFTIEIADDETEVYYDEVIEALKAEDNEDTVDILVESVIDAIETQKGQKSGDAALKAVSQAHSKLISVDLTRANQATHSKIKRQLDSIEVMAQKLKETLSRMINS